MAERRCVWMAEAEVVEEGGEVEGEEGEWGEVVEVGDMGERSLMARRDVVVGDRPKRRKESVIYILGEGVRVVRDGEM